MNTRAHEVVFVLSLLLVFPACIIGGSVGGGLAWLSIILAAVSGVMANGDREFEDWS